MADFVESLVEMGFTREKAEKAVQVTGNKGVEPAMEWILQNNEVDQPASSNAALASASNSEVAEGNSKNSEDTSEDGVNVRSYKCDECGKILKDVEAMEYHAAKSNHSKFSESSEEKKALTEEEKAEQLRLIEEKIKVKRKERENREKQDELEREKSRVAIGKELAEAKRRLQDQEMKEIAETRRREKIDDKKARDRVKAQIEADKLARKAKFAQQNQGAATDAEPPKPALVLTPTKSVEAATPTPKKDYTETKLQVRLPNGKTLLQTFGVNEPLAAVRLYVELHRDDSVQGSFNLMTSFPRKVYQEDEYDMPLEALGLVPSAVLMVTRPT